jgi:hypothetical protein
MRHALFIMRAHRIAFESNDLKKLARDRRRVAVIALPLTGDEKLSSTKDARRSRRKISLST